MWTSHILDEKGKKISIKVLKLYWFTFESKRRKGVKSALDSYDGFLL